MSRYANFDHAGWVEDQIEASKRMAARLKRHRDAGEKGIGWLGAPDELTPFQRKAFTILGIVGGGIYNAPIAWDSIDWRHGGGIAVSWGTHRTLATFDNDALTLLVFLCHEARFRCAIGGTASRYMRIAIWPRSHDGDSYSRHPNIEEAIASFRTWLREDHPLVYQVPARPANVMTKREILAEMAKGRALRFSEDGDNAWLSGMRTPFDASVDPIIAELHEGKLIEPIPDDNDNRLSGSLFRLTQAGHAALGILNAQAVAHA